VGCQSDPLVDGFVTESLDGKQVAPLMGDYTEAADVVLCACVCSRTSGSMLVVITALLCADPQRSIQHRHPDDLAVDAKAEESRDYDLDKLLPFWLYTAEQDWAICVNHSACQFPCLYPWAPLHLQGIQPRSIPAVVSTPDAGRDRIARTDDLLASFLRGLRMLTPVVDCCGGSAA